METALSIKIGLLLIILGIPGVLCMAFLMADAIEGFVSRILHHRPL